MTAYAIELHEKVETFGRPLSPSADPTPPGHHCIRRGCVGGSGRDPREPDPIGREPAVEQLVSAVG